MKLINRIIQCKGLLLLLMLCWVYIGEAMAAARRDPYQDVLPIAREGVRMYRENADRERTLARLQEAFVRGQEWVPTDESRMEEARAMGEVVGGIILLREELRGEDRDRLMLQFLVRSGVEAVKREENQFGGSPNIYPEEAGDAVGAEGLSDWEILDRAVDLIWRGEAKEGKGLLLRLYSRCWLAGDSSESELKYDVANRLGALYLALGTMEKGQNLLRQNKLEMDKAACNAKQYVETLALMAYGMNATGLEILAKCYADVAEDLAKRNGIEIQQIIREYSPILYTGGGSRTEVDTFIGNNDRVFSFLTEKERLQRWGTVQGSWERIKSRLVGKSGEVTDIAACLNAFEYEKQLMLRSATVTQETLNCSWEAGAKLDTLNMIKMRMAGQIGPYEWEELNARYDRIQKALMHDVVLARAIPSLYRHITPKEIAAGLRRDETFIDFGRIDRGGEPWLYALVVTSETPQGRAVALCREEELRQFLKRTASSETRKMVRERYGASFLSEKVWLPLVDTGLMKEKVFYSPAGAMNDVMPDAIREGGIPVGEVRSFHILSSASALEDVRKSERYRPGSVTSFYGIDYICHPKELIDEARLAGDRPNAPFTPLEADNDINYAFSIRESVPRLDDSPLYQRVGELLAEKGVPTLNLTGAYANEYRFKSLSGTYGDAINISTHAFYLPKDADPELYPYLMNQSVSLCNVEGEYDEEAGMVRYSLLPMFRSGLLLSGGERNWCGRNIISRIEDGVLNAEEISAMDLSGYRLVTLMACGTGEGDIMEYEGVMGLRRAFKMAGCGSLVTTAWNVDLEAAEAYLGAFYESLMEGAGVPASHRKAQIELIKRFDDPYYWALFQLVD